MTKRAPRRHLTLACGTCNQAKGSTPVETFLARSPARLARRPLRDAAAMNATRFAVCDAIAARTGLPVSLMTPPIPRIVAGS